MSSNDTLSARAEARELARDTVARRIHERTSCALHDYFRLDGDGDPLADPRLLLECAGYPEIKSIDEDYLVAGQLAFVVAAVAWALFEGLAPAHALAPAMLRIAKSVGVDLEGLRPEFRAWAHRVATEPLAGDLGELDDEVAAWAEYEAHPARRRERRAAYVVSHAGPTRRFLDLDKARAFAQERGLSATTELWESDAFEADDHHRENPGPLETFRPPVDRDAFTVEPHHGVALRADTLEAARSLARQLIGDDNPQVLIWLTGTYLLADADHRAEALGQPNGPLEVISGVWRETVSCQPPELDCARALDLGRKLLWFGRVQPECVRAAGRATSSRELAELLESATIDSD
jgi:hypothetical protein